jgi:hypothetical protein
LTPPTGALSPAHLGNLEEQGWGGAVAPGPRGRRA